MGGGFLYLAAVMHWFARRILLGVSRLRLYDVLHRRVDETDMRLYGRPEIFNSDQAR